MAEQGEATRAEAEKIVQQAIDTATAEVRKENAELKRHRDGLLQVLKRIMKITTDDDLSREQAIAAIRRESGTAIREAR